MRTELLASSQSGCSVDTYTWCKYSGGSKGGMRDAHPPGGPNSFNCRQFLGNFSKIVCWCPPGELAPPPRGNPGSATEIDPWGGECPTSDWLWRLTIQIGFMRAVHLIRFATVVIRLCAQGT